MENSVKRLRVQASLKAQRSVIEQDIYPLLSTGLTQDINKQLLTGT